MKKIMFGLAALLTIGVGAVCAQDRGHHGGGDKGGFERGAGFGYGERGPGRAYGGGYGPGGRAGLAPPSYERPGYPPRSVYPGALPLYGGPQARGGGPRGFTRGQFLPPAYFGGGVADPRQYHLRRPPNGYGWVVVGPNAYLTQRSTGLILDTAPLY